MARLGPDFVNGREIKFGNAVRQHYLGLIRQGVKRYAAAKACNVRPETVLRARKRDPWFDEACKEAQLEALEEVESLLWLAAQRGEPWAIQMLLRQLDRDRWAEVKKVDVDVRVEIDAGEVVQRIESLRRMLESREMLELEAGDIVDAELVDVDVDAEEPPG